MIKLGILLGSSEMFSFIEQPEQLKSSKPKIFLIKLKVNKNRQRAQMT